MPKIAQPTELSLSFANAQQLINEAMQPLSEPEQITLTAALDRITFDDIIAPRNVPPFDNSAMDGYAFCARDLVSTQQLIVAGDSLAGHPFQGNVQVGHAIRITTGAKMPERCDTVLPQELATRLGDNTLNMQNTVVHTGQNRRRCGEDLKSGDIAIKKGTRLGAAELGLLASLGITDLQVQRRLRVALFSTGDELRSIGQTLDAGAIFDSNRIILQSMLKRFGADVIDLGVLNDDPTELKTALARVAPQVDVIITSGGVASGAADYTKQIMGELGDMTFLSINMRPGRSLVFGKINEPVGDAYLFGLPGNPVAVMVSFYFFVRPALQLLSGTKVTKPIPISAVAMQRIPKKIGRTEFQRGVCELSEQGQLQVSLIGKQGSGILSSMSRANCMLVLNQEQGDIDAGDTVKIILFDGLI